MSGTDAAAASAVCIHDVVIAYRGGSSRPPYYVHDKIHTAAAEAAEAASSKSVLAIHSIYEKLSHELPTRYDDGLL